MRGRRDNSRPSSTPALSGSKPHLDEAVNPQRSLYPPLPSLHTQQFLLPQQVPLAKGRAAGELSPGWVRRGAKGVGAEEPTRPYLEHDDADLFDALDDGLWDPGDGDGTLSRVGQHVTGHLDLCPRALDQKIKIAGERPVTSATNPAGHVTQSQNCPPHPKNKTF